MMPGFESFFTGRNRLLRPAAQLFSYLLIALVPLLMLHSEPGTAHYLFYFSLFAIPILLLLYFAGPMIAAAAAIFAGVVGMCGFLFTLSRISKGIPFAFLAQTAWLWVLFWLTEKLIEKRDFEIHRMQEEIEKLELYSATHQQEQKELEESCTGIRERIFNYSQLRIFTDELTAPLQVEELRGQVELSLRRLFGTGPGVSVRMRLFKAPNLPQEKDIVGRFLAEHRVPVYVPQTAEDARFSALAQKKVAAMMAAPLEMGETVIGTLAVDSASPNHWSKEDVRFLSGVASLVSVAMGNALLYQKIESLAERDLLTRLYVRYRFEERVEEEFARSKATHAPLSLLILDIDHFKKVNDRWGHAVGDVVLQTVAQAVLAQSRETDFCARYGGEEIAVIMPATRSQNAYLLAERIRNKIAITSVEPEKIKVTVSGGIASFSGRLNTARELVAAADQALYEAKSAGRNRVVLHKA